MKVRVLPVEEGLEPKFRIIAETVEDELFLKQLSGMYGDGSISLEDVVFNGDGVSSLVVVGDAFPFPGDFCTKVQQCMAGFTSENPAVQAPATVLIQNTTYSLEGYQLKFIGNTIDGDVLVRDFDADGNDIGGIQGSNIIGADNVFNTIIGINNSIGNDNSLNTIIGVGNTIGNDNGTSLIIGDNNTIADSVFFNIIGGEGHNVLSNYSYLYGSYSENVSGGGIVLGKGTDNLNRSNAFVAHIDGHVYHSGAYANKPTRYTGGGNHTIPDNVSVYIYDPASIQAGATITLPANPLDGQDLYIIGGGTITSGNVITGFTLDGNGRTVIGDGSANLKVGKAYELHYCDENNIWYAISF